MGVIKINLPYNLVKQFTQATHDVNKSNDFIYGTVVVSGNSKYVNLDGSNINTPVNTLTEIKDGDRVFCTIKNHEVQVLGNTTTPSTSLETVTDSAVDRFSGLFNSIRANILDACNDPTTEIYNAIRLVSNSVTSDIYWDDLTEPPTLTNYPANTFSSYRMYKEHIDFKHTFKLTGEALYKKYLGAKAFMADGSRSWIFSYENGEYFWKEVDDLTKDIIERIHILESDSSTWRSEIDEIAVRVGNQNTSIEKLSSEILQQAGQIALRVTKDIYSTDMEGKANKDTIVSEINMSPEEIKISADKINITGAVTFESLDSTVKNAMDDATVTANNADDMARYATRRADDAYELAANTNQVASTAYTEAIDAYNKASLATAKAAEAYNGLDGLLWPYDKTCIDGSKIATGTITANQITTGTLTGVVISGCTITATDEFKMQVMNGSYVSSYTVMGTEYKSYQTLYGYTRTGNVLHIAGEKNGISYPYDRTNWINVRIDSDVDINGTLATSGAIFTKGSDFYYNSKWWDYCGLYVAGRIYCSGQINPETDNMRTLGNSDLRWNKVYSVNGVSSTSDRRSKEDIIEFDERHEKMFNELRPVTFKYNFDNEKRVHSGFVAQEVEEALINNNINEETFAALDYDVKDSDKKYSLQYHEFIALNTHMIQKLQKELEEVKMELKQLKECE